MQLIINKNEQNKVSVSAMTYSYLRDKGLHRTVNFSLNLDKADEGVAYLVGLVENGTQVTDIDLLSDDGTITYQHLTDTFTINQISDRIETNNRFIEVEFEKYDN